MRKVQGIRYNLRQEIDIFKFIAICFDRRLKYYFLLMIGKTIMTKSGSFEFLDNYSSSVKQLQPELYSEIENILNNKFISFYETYNRKTGYFGY